jgi:hypothetical protein
MKLTHNEIKDLLLNKPKFIKRSTEIDEETFSVESNENEIEYLDSFGVKSNDSIYFFKKDNKYIMCSSNDQTHLVLGEFEMENGEELDVHNLPINFKEHI